MKEVFNFF